MDNPTAAVTVTQYTVTVFPDEGIDSVVYDLVVEYRGHGRWAVTRGRRCLALDGGWDFEIQPSDRDDTWLAGHRFDLDTALRLAREAAPNVRINGSTAAEAAQEAGL
jgi:hypothetical protein